MQTVFVLSRLIRLELNQSLCDYYTELDAVYLTGTKSTDDEFHQKAVEHAIDYLNVTKMLLNDSEDLFDDEANQLQYEPSVEDRDCCGSFKVLPVCILNISFSASH